MIKSVKSRIKASYIEGRGDNGVSTYCNLCNPKTFSNVEFDIYTKLELLRNNIGKILNPNIIDSWVFDRKVKDNKFRLFLEWLNDNSFSMGALITARGNSTRHQFNQSTLISIEKYINTIKKELGDCQDFLIHNGFFSELDMIRVNIREIERLYVEYQNDIPHENLKLCSSILNRSSSAVFWAIRKEYKLRNKKESYWNGKSTPFNL